MRRNEHGDIMLRAYFSFERSTSKIQFAWWSALVKSLEKETSHNLKPLEVLEERLQHTLRQ